MGLMYDEVVGAWERAEIPMTWRSVLTDAMAGRPSLVFAHSHDDEPGTVDLAHWLGFLPPPAVGVSELIIEGITVAACKAEGTRAVGLVYLAVKERPGDHRVHVYEIWETATEVWSAHSEFDPDDTEMPWCNIESGIAGETLVGVSLFDRTVLAWLHAIHMQHQLVIEIGQHANRNGQGGTS